MKPDTAELAERLAQAERTAAANLRNYKELLEAAERERDDWREKANTTAAWVQAHGLNVTELTAERDAARAEEDTWRTRWVEDVAEAQRQRGAALAKADELTRKHQHSEAGRMAAVGRADAAESELADRIKSAQHYGHEAALAHEQLADLRVRITALADKGDRTYVGDWPAQLRALLQPAKPETALDVLARMQAGWGSGDDEYGDAEFTDDMAKLRKLLEADLAEKPTAE